MGICQLSTFFCLALLLKSAQTAYYNICDDFGVKIHPMSVYTASAH